MKADYKIKAETKRIALQDAIPLSTPLRVFLETASICNFHCFFCPQGGGGYKNTGDRIMSLAFAKKCIDDLKYFPEKIKLLTLSTVGEPLINKDLSEIVLYAKNQQVAEKIDLTTNASLMTHDLANKLIASGIDKMDISIYGLSDAQYYRTSSAKLDFKELVENISYLYNIGKQCKIAVKICDAAFEKNKDKEYFLKTFQNICDAISVERVVPIWYEFENSDKIDNTLTDIYGNDRVRKEICPLPFFQMEIHSNGKVSQCCQDWKHKLVIGDAYQETLLDIWNGKVNLELCVKQLKDGRRSIPVCSGCEYPEVVAFDNIDAHREKLLKKYGI